MKTTLLRMNDEEWQRLVPSRFHDVGEAGVLTIAEYISKYLDSAVAHLPTSAAYLWQRARHPHRSAYILVHSNNNSENDTVEWVKAEGEEEDAVVIQRNWQGAGYRGVGHYYVRVLDGVTVFDRGHPLLAQLRDIAEEHELNNSPRETQAEARGREDDASAGVRPRVEHGGVKGEGGADESRTPTSMTSDLGIHHHTSLNLPPSLLISTDPVLRRGPRHSHEASR